MTFDFEIIMKICGAVIIILTTIVACILLIWGIIALICGLIDYLKFYKTGLKKESTLSNYGDMLRR